MAKTAAKPDLVPASDSFFDLTLKGRIPAILREIANRIDNQDVSAEDFHCKLSRGVVELSMRMLIDGGR